MTIRPSPVLTVRGVVKAFGPRRVLDGVDLALDAGERRVLVGMNGAGKTALFDIITGLLPPDEGSVLLGDADVTVLPAHARARRGLARTFQVSQVFGALTARENVALALHGARGTGTGLAVSDAARARADASALLSEWGLGERGALPASLLSYGERRRLDVLLAVAQRPRALLLDEPTSGLSGVEIDLLLAALRRLDASTCLLVTEHDQDVAARIGDTVSSLEHGHIAWTVPGARRSA